MKQLVLTLLLAPAAVARPVELPVPFAVSMPDYSAATLRRHYEQAAAGKEAGEAFYQHLRGYDGPDALVLAYKATSEAIKARDASMLSKLSYVQQAARTFEQAVAGDAQNAEIRFLRFSVESNLPPFLGLSKHVDEDRDLLVAAVLQYPRSGLDEVALRTVRDFLVQRGHVAADVAAKLGAVQA